MINVWALIGVLGALLAAYLIFNEWAWRAERKINEDAIKDLGKPDGFTKNGFVEIKRHDPLKRELITKALDTGKLILGHQNEDGSITTQELEPGVDWPDAQEVDELLEHEIPETFLDAANKELDQVRVRKFKEG